EWRFERFQRPQPGGRARGLEEPQRIARDRRIPPRPEQPPPMLRDLNAVASEHARFSPRFLQTEPLTFAEQSGSRESAQPLRRKVPLDLHLGHAAGFRRQADTLVSKAIGSDSIAVA